MASSAPDPDFDDSRTILSQNIAPKGTGYQSQYSGSGQQVNAGGGTQYNAQAIHISQAQPSGGGSSTVNNYCALSSRRHVKKWRYAPGRRRTSTTLTARQSYDERVLERISSYDYESIHQRLSQKRLKGTTQWFLDHLDFKAWFTDKTTSCLWCTGTIGSGKTMIATAVVEVAKDRTTELGGPTVFFYCDSVHYGVLDEAYIVSSFIKQLCEFLRQKSQHCPEHIKKDIVKHFGPNRTRPDFNDLRNLFVKLFYHVPNTIYIIDGIDALQPDHAKHFLFFVRGLFGSHDPPPGSMLLLSSRDHFHESIDISFLQEFRRISTFSNTTQDIETYIEIHTTDKMMCRKLTDDRALLEKIKLALLSRSSGMFLWVHLQLEILWDTCHTDAEIVSALAKLPKGLKETYRRCVGRINFQDRWPLKVLKWVSFSAQPLHMNELREAVAFDIGDTTWSARNKPQGDFLISCCANLVVVDPADNCVRFAHSSVRQYLDEASLIAGYPTAEQGELECGEHCVTYLCFSDFSLQPTRYSAKRVVVEVRPRVFFTQEAFRTGFKRFLCRIHGNRNRRGSMVFHTLSTASTPNQTQYGFLRYAIRNWALQTKSLSPTSLVWEKFKQLALCSNETWNFHPWGPHHDGSQESHLRGLFGWAVMEQHKPLLSIAKATGPLLELVCDRLLIGERLPALHFASKFGYESIITALLDFCRVNGRDHQRYTALHHAAGKGHLKICELLLSAKEIEVDAQCYSKCTPLWLAAGNGHHDVASLLLKKGANIEAMDRHHQYTPLSQAAKLGHVAVVELLVDKGADIEANSKLRRSYIASLSNIKAKGVIDRTPLSCAAEKGHVAVVNLLAEHGANVEAQDRKSWTPLLLAAGNGHEAMVKLLVEKGANMEAKEKDGGQTSLACAAWNGHEAVVKLLIGMGADIDAKAKFERTPLSLAAGKGQEAVIKLLIDEGVDIEAKDVDQRTPLCWAAANGNEAMVKLLIERGADIEAKTNWGRTPLLWAAERGRKAVVNLLIEKGANIEAKTKFSFTPLLSAAEKGHTAIVELLLEKSADIEAKDGNSRTPLSWASGGGHKAIVELLIHKGANIEAKTNFGRTPLSWAAEKGHKPVVELLVKKGADTKAMDNFSWTPLS